jgi:hypothetical protein
MRRGRSTAQRTMRLSAAPVGMTAIVDAIGVVSAVAAEAVDEAAVAFGGALVGSGCGPGHGAE